MKQILTHRILPILGVLLFVFNIFIVSNVFAYSYSYQSTELHENIVNSIKDLENFGDYRYYLCHAEFNGGGYVEVYLYNDSTITWHCSTRDGWDSVRSSGVFSFYHYVLLFENQNGVPVFKEVVRGFEENNSINNIITSCWGVDYQKYAVWGNVNIYGNSLDDIWYEGIDLFVSPEFGETTESINNLTGGYCLIFPRFFG